MPELEDRKPSLSDLLALERPPQEEGRPALSPQEVEQQQFLSKMRELARGLVGSEYWQLVSLVLIEGLEDAKGALESETTSDKDMRIKQGEAKALRSAFNLIVDLGKSEETRDGKEPD